MCGAAAESALLAVAIAKVGEEASVLREYHQSRGRQNIVKRVFGGSPDRLQLRFIESAVYLLTFWRDETAHGRVSEISELEAYHALTLLLRLAAHLFAEWEQLTE